MSTVERAHRGSQPPGVVGQVYAARASQGVEARVVHVHHQSRGHAFAAGIDCLKCPAFAVAACHFVAEALYLQAQLCGFPKFCGDGLHSVIAVQVRAYLQTPVVGVHVGDAHLHIVEAALHILAAETDGAVLGEVAEIDPCAGCVGAYSQGHLGGPGSCGRRFVHHFHESGGQLGGSGIIYYGAHLAGHGH